MQSDVRGCEMFALNQDKDGGAMDDGGQRRYGDAQWCQAGGMVVKIILGRYSTTRDGLHKTDFLIASQPPVPVGLRVGE